MTENLREQLRSWADTYNDPVWFQEDPIAFPREFVRRGASLQDVEVAAVFAAHFAWGRRAMIVRDCTRLFDEMEWRPYDYVMAGAYRSDPVSIHRTVKWSEVSAICSRLKTFYSGRGIAATTVAGIQSSISETAGPGVCPQTRKGEKTARGSEADKGVEPPSMAEGGTGDRGGTPTISAKPTLEQLSAAQIRTMIYGQKEDARAANKKINMMRRWMVRDDGKVDLGVWKNTPKTDLVIPLDVHVYRQATELGLTSRKQKDIVTAKQITDSFLEIWPEDPAKGDFALFGYGVTHPKSAEDEE